MYAVIKTGGKQYKLEPGTTLAVEKLDAEVGSRVELPALLVNDGDKLLTGKDAEAAVVTAEVVEHVKGDKVVVFKFKKRKGYKRLKGHRQNYTKLLVTEIAVGGKKAKAAEPKVVAKPVSDKPAAKKAPVKKAPAKATPAAAPIVDQAKAETPAKPAVRKAPAAKKPATKPAAEVKAETATEPAAKKAPAAKQPAAKPAAKPAAAKKAPAAKPAAAEKSPAVKKPAAKPAAKKTEKPAE